MELVSQAQLSASELAQAQRIKMQAEFAEFGATLATTNHVFAADLVYVVAQPHSVFKSDELTALDKATAALGYAPSSSAVLSISTLAAESQEWCTQAASAESSDVPHTLALAIQYVIEALDPQVVIVLEATRAEAQFDVEFGWLDHMRVQWVSIPDFFAALGNDEDKRMAWVYMLQVKKKPE